MLILMLILLFLWCITGLVWVLECSMTLYHNKYEQMIFALLGQGTNYNVKQSVFTLALMGPLACFIAVAWIIVHYVKLGYNKVMDYLSK